MTHSVLGRQEFDKTIFREYTRHVLCTHALFLKLVPLMAFYQSWIPELIDESFQFD